MTTTLQPGQQVTGQTTKRVFTVLRSIAQGGQGEVLLAEWNNNQYAIKWYFPRSATPQQRLRIEKLVGDKAPSQHYLWPLDLVTANGIDGFGYVMFLRPPQYLKITRIKAMCNDAMLTTIVEVSRNLAMAFRDLHIKGLAYFDIKGDNGFFDPATASVLICDCDNVTFSGDQTQIAGTFPYMAPELILGKAKPSARTDLHSLAVLLFELMVRNHPLEGKQEGEFEVLDYAARRKIYGESPLFIFDPKDSRNRPDPHWHPNAQFFWNMLPTFLQELFTKAFTVGLHDPSQRIVESEWIKAFVRLLDGIALCPDCQSEVYTDPMTNTKASCWFCQKVVPTPMHLELKDRSKKGDPVVHRIVLHATVDGVPAKRLFRDHFDSSLLLGERGKPIGIVEAHPNNPKVLGLANLSDVAWRYRSTSGEEHPLEPTKRAQLSPGVRITFGGTHIYGDVV
jgi:DNA-binding helix-hairpin-helix protein with protein kinase domain